MAQEDVRLGERRPICTVRGGGLQNLQGKISDFSVFTCLFSNKYLQVNYSCGKSIYCVPLYTDATVLCTFLNIIWNFIKNLRIRFNIHTNRISINILYQWIILCRPGILLTYFRYYWFRRERLNFGCVLEIAGCILEQLLLNLWMWDPYIWIFLSQRILVWSQG